MEKPLIERFIEYQANYGQGKDGGGVGNRRIAKYRSLHNTLNRLAGGDFDACLHDLPNLERLVKGINDTKDYAAWTKADMKTLIKQLWKMENGLDQEDRPKELRFIKSTVPHKLMKLPELISEAEAKKMIEGASSLRNKAMIHLLYESGIRAGELMALKKKHIEFVKNGIRLTVPDGTKTGSRKILVMDCEPTMAAWMANHPIKNQEAWLFHNFGGPQGKPLGHASINKILRETAERAGIHRRIHAHLFRHSCATRMANHLTDAQMKTFFGWGQSSEMASVYIHMSGEDTDDAVIEAHGKPVDRKAQENIMAPHICARCGKQNAHDAALCQYCGLPTDKDAAKKSDLVLAEQYKKMEARLEKLENIRKESFKKKAK